ncbi:MAG: helix-hairpin-helix domain-containing protein [Candidatus Thorarchaeota archaeon]
MSKFKVEDVSKEDTVRILEILNSVKTAKKLEEIITIPDRPTLEKELAENIFQYRKKTGLFTELIQLDEVPEVGPSRLESIVRSLQEYRPPSVDATLTTSSHRFTGESMLPILRYDIPSPSSYEGRNYIELRNLTFDGNHLTFSDEASSGISSEKFIEVNRANIYEYVKNTSNEEFERDLYLVLDLDMVEVSEIVLQYPGVYTFEKDQVGEPPDGWISVGVADGRTFEVVDEKVGHKSVLHFRDESTTGYLRHHVEFDKQVNGTIEFWTFQDTKTWFYVDLQEGDKTGITLCFGRTNFYYTDHTQPKNQNRNVAQNLDGNRWHHHRIDFNAAANSGNGSFDYYIDQVLRKGNIRFRNSVTGINKFRIASTVGGQNIIGYIDGIGFDWHPDYNIGDNLNQQAIEIQKEEILASSQQTDPKIVEMIKLLDADVTFGTKYHLFKFLLQYAISTRKFPVFYRSMGGKLRLRFVNVPGTADPRLVLAETYRLTSFPGDYGAGTTIKTFSLLPKEVTEISIKTWKKTAATTKEASSILDSYTEDKADEFESSVQAENSSTSKVEESTSYHAEASAGGSWGGCNVKVEAGVKGSTNSSREEFSKNVMNSASKHAQSASAKREVSIDTSFESTEETGEEVVIMRRVENMNASRTLNFIFRQMNQQYHSLLHITDVRIAFYNGYPGSMQEYSLFEINDLVDEYMEDTVSDDEIVLLSKAQIKEHLRRFILTEYTNVIDHQGKPGTLLEEVTLKGTNNNDLKYIRVIPSLQQEYTLREEPEDIRHVDGIIVGKKVLTLKTDGVVVESLLGESNALDEYSVQTREELVRQDRLKNSLSESEIAKIDVGVEIIKKYIEAGKLEKSIEAYREIFGYQEGLKYMGEIFTKPRLEVESSDQKQK